MTVFVRALHAAGLACLLAGGAAAQTPPPSSPRTYEDCILQNMSGATTDAVARQLREACRGKFPAPPPERKEVSVCEGHFDGLGMRDGPPKDEPDYDVYEFPYGPQRVARVFFPKTLITTDDRLIERESGPWIRRRCR